MTWIPPQGALAELIELAEADAAAQPKSTKPTPGIPDVESNRFIKAIREYNDGFPLICEIKRASPSAGDIAANANPIEIAQIYERAKACCISVLTERHQFGGSLGDLADVNSVVSIPTLRKDFIVDTTMIEEAARAGAACVLLIVAGVEPKKLIDLADAADDLGIDILLEIIYERDLEALELRDWPLVGVNARDLATLEVDPQRFARLAPQIIDGNRLLVAESGINSPDDVAKYRQAGAHAVLVGESLMRSADPSSLIASMRKM